MPLTTNPSPAKMATKLVITENNDSAASVLKRDVANPHEMDEGEFGARQTSARWKLQYKRQVLNHKILLQTKLRDGAENLMKALRITNDRKTKLAAKTELSFANSQLEALKEELEGINSTLDVYQFDRSVEHQIPLIAVGLRETKDLEFKDHFRDFILDHYSDAPEKYEKELDLFENMRKEAVSRVNRDETGVHALLMYYNQLYFVERKFFGKGKGNIMPVYFHWFDTTTGLPKIQKSIAFEKASILFNIGSIWSQIGAKQDRRTQSGLAKAIDAFNNAAGAFKLIKENFINSPTADLTMELMDMLMAVMLAQSQLCIWEEHVLEGTNDTLADQISAAEECAEISHKYKKAQMMMNTGICLCCVPSSWKNMMSIMCLHYKALAHYFVADGLLKSIGDSDDEMHKEIAVSLLQTSQSDNDTNRTKQAKAHLHSALKSHEEAMKARQICRHCRKVVGLQKALQDARMKTTETLVAMEEEDDFDDPVMPTPVRALARVRATCIPPNFSSASVEDLFHRLGPVHVFNAKLGWSAPKTIELKRRNGGYGFSVIGSAPVIIQSVENDGPAKEAGFQVGDIIVGVDKTDCKWGDHTSVVSLIRNTDTSVSIDLVTPTSLKEIAEIYNVKLARDEQVVTSDYGSSISSESSNSSPSSTLNGVYSLTGSSSFGSTRGTPSHHSAVLATGNESILW
ncbi:rhophilin-2-B-like isoform X1 [Montipora capricornis]|uniref:rhophilin-2-B-like isoform X1 n=1 Tax=Montipora capricornis TaxID=246305 RepID=UPI0035F1DA07